MLIFHGLMLCDMTYSPVSSSVLPINDNSRECTPTPTVSERPESSAIGLRFNKLSTPYPRTSDYQIPSTPAPPSLLLNNQLISGRMANRRNINTATLRPIEKPKTPALVAMDSGIRGFRLGGNVSHYSPPSTPYVRHTQLPPLEGAAGGQAMLLSDRSPNTQARISMQQQQRNRVTFNSRIVSVDDGSELWHLSRPAGRDLRPNTTSTPSRPVIPDGQKSSLGRKVSDNNLHFGRMKVVGYAAGFHGGGGRDLREKVTSAVIAEGEEMPDEEQPTSFTITGKSEIFRKYLCMSIGQCLEPLSYYSETSGTQHFCPL